MPVMDGIAATQAIRKALPDTEVIALTSVLEDRLVYDAIRVGAMGYLLKDTEGRRALQGDQGRSGGPGSALPGSRKTS